MLGEVIEDDRLRAGVGLIIDGSGDGSAESNDASFSEFGMGVIISKCDGVDSDGKAGDDEGIPLGEFGGEDVGVILLSVSASCSSCIDRSTLSRSSIRLICSSPTCCCTNNNKFFTACTEASDG